MGIKKELGKKIKRMRIEKGFTQERLAELIDISQKALSSIETGENFVKAETLDKILTAFDITPEELFSVNHLKSSAELIKMINNNIAQIGDNSEKLEIIYNLTKSLRVK